MGETGDTLEAGAAEREGEIASARQVFRELDKAWRATRTYGLANAVTRRFFEQLQALMIAHLDAFVVLPVIVDRAELRLYGESVYRSEDSLGESLAFRLYGDGVREVRIEQGVSPEDLHAFLDALWVRDDASDADDDVVTRLWAKDLATISFVTAEDIVQAPWSADLEPQEHGFFSSPPASFDGVLERERKLAASAPTATGPGPAAAGENLPRGGSGALVGYELTPGERAMLDAALTAESAIDSDAMVLSMLRAILAAETAPDLLTRALGTVPAALDVLLSLGRWPLLAEVLAILEDTPAQNPAFEATHKMISERVLDSINLPQRLALIEQGLKRDPERPLSGLSSVFTRLTPAAVGPLCGVLANLTDDEHRGALRDTIIRLGAENPEPVLKHLADPRPQFVLDVVTIIVAWQQPQAAGVLSMLAHHPAAAVRKEALDSIARLKARGDGAPIVAFVSDPEPEMRLNALRLLATGRYTAKWDDWQPHLKDLEVVVEQERALKRVLLHALRVTAGDAAVPLCEALIEGRGWKNRSQREETALLAVKELAALGTPRALAALQAGSAQASGAIRKACAAALASRKS